MVVGAEEAATKIAAEVDRMEAKLAASPPVPGKLPNRDVLRYVAQLLVHRATLEKVRGDESAARATLAEAIRRCALHNPIDVVLDATALAAGLSFPEP